MSEQSKGVPPRKRAAPAPHPPSDDAPRSAPAEHGHASVAPGGTDPYSGLPVAAGPEARARITGTALGRPTPGSFPIGRLPNLELPPEEADAPADPTAVSDADEPPISEEAPGDVEDASDTRFAEPDVDDTDTDRGLSVSDDAPDTFPLDFQSIHGALTRASANFDQRHAPLRPPLPPPLPPRLPHNAVFRPLPSPPGHPEEPQPSRVAEPSFFFPANSELLRQPPSVATRGWRRTVRRSTFGLVALGPSAQERQEMDLHGRIRAPLLSTFKVGFVGKGGVGKTTVTASVGSILAHVRHGDPVVAIDADTGFGKLASRIDDRAVNSYWELVAEDADVGFAGVQSHLGANSAGLFVLPGDPRTASRRRVLSPAVYRAAATRMEEHFGVVLVDCSATMDTPVTHEALADLDAAIVVASPWADGASVAGQTMAWLAVYGYGELLRRTIVVVNDSDGHGVKRNKAELVGRFGELGHPVFNLPFDGSLRSGGIIDTTNGIASATRLSLLQIAAAVAQYFPEGALEHRNR